MKQLTQAPAGGRRHRYAWACALAITLAVAACGGNDAPVAEADASAGRAKALASAALVDTDAAVVAGAGDSVFTEAGKLVRSNDNVVTLGNDLFGDRVNLYNGTLEFVHTDLSLPGNNALPVAVGRRLSTGKSIVTTGHFGDWDLEIPRLHGIFTASMGWSVGAGQSDANGSRCTNFGPPPQAIAQNSQGTYDAHEYWHGSFLYVPGSGSQEILRRSLPDKTINPANPLNPAAGGAPTDGNLVTKEGWRLYCNTPLRNSTSEGFTAISPDGTRYVFDRMVTRLYTNINKPLGTPPDYLTTGTPGADTGEEPAPNLQAFVSTLKRKEVWILPSQVIDRHGNVVRYNYDPLNTWRLLSVESDEVGSAPRKITFKYESPLGSSLISEASDGVRRWTYGYRASSVSGAPVGTVLSSVGLPDGSAWGINMDAIGNPIQNDWAEGGCDGQGAMSQRDATASMTHPSGAVGQFGMAPTFHGRSHVLRDCRGSVWDGTDWSFYPLYINAYSITSKKITGAGLPAAGHLWTYIYGPANASFAPCSGCAETKTVTVTDPQAAQTRYTFGNRFRVNEGQLLQVDESWYVGTALRTTVRQYALPTAGPYPDPVGYSVQRRTEGDLSLRHTPERLRSTTLQGHTFTWQATAFDTRGRPTTITRSNTLGTPGTTRSERTTYFDHTDRWVLGQVASLTETATGLVMEQHTYDPVTLNRATSTTFGQPGQRFTYLGDGNLRTRANDAGHTTTFANYKRGLAQDVTYADGATEHADVNDLGQITALRNAAGTTTGYAYDAIGRLRLITPPNEPDLIYQPTTLSFQRMGAAERQLPAGYWKQVVTTGSALTERYFDALWRPVLTHTRDTLAAGSGSATVKRYDTSNRLVFESYPQRDIADANALLDGTATTYDTLGRTVRVERDSELGKLSTLTAYLADFRTQVTNPRGFVTVTRGHALDDPGTASAATIWLPLAVTVNISRDVFGKPTAITRSGGGKSLTRSYVYDAQQRLCKTLEPETGATVQAYHALTGLLGWRASGLALPGAGCDQASVPTARKINFGYDTRGRLASTSYGDGSPGVSRGYTPDGLLQQTTTHHPTNPVTWTYEYYNRRILKRESYSGGWSFTWGVDANGNASSLTDPWGTMDYSPNALGQPTQVSGYASNVTYHPSGAVATYTLGNLVSHSTTLNTRGLPLRMSNSGISQDLYAYDANRNVTGITDEREGVNTRSMPDYDGLDRLRRADGPWGSGTYTYDALDNLTSSTLTGSGAAPPRTLTHNVNPTTNRIDSLSGTQSVGFTYDDNGNITQRATQSFTFDIGNRMVSAPGKVNYYLYDGHGRRMLVWYANGSHMHQAYTKDGKLRFGQHSVDGHTRFVYLGDTLIAEATGSGTTYQHADALGSPIARSNSSGGLVSRTRYEPYGATVAGSTNPAKIGFTGHVNDADTGLVYMQQRYYDPIAGRFLSVDPVVADTTSGRGFNRYAYALNNPFRFIDPDGADPTGALTVWPVPGHGELNKRDTSRGQGNGQFGSPRGTSRTHTGIDVPAPVGTPVVASGDGKVVNIQPNPSGTYGTQVVIDHGDGVFTQSAHLDSSNVKPGDAVSAGQQVGTVGTSGNTPAAADSHLHFEVRLGSPKPQSAGGRVTDPLKRLPPPPPPPKKETVQ